MGLLNLIQIMDSSAGRRNCPSTVRRCRPSLYIGRHFLQRESVSRGFVLFRNTRCMRPITISTLTAAELRAITPIGSEPDRVFRINSDGRCDNLSYGQKNNSPRETMTASSLSDGTSRMRAWIEELRQSENQLVLLLSLVVGLLVGMVTVGFILVTGRLAAHMYPAGGAGWRRILVPTLGSLSAGYLLAKFFPFARGSGIPQAKFALVVNDGHHHVPHHHWEVAVLLHFARERHRAGTRRSFGAGGRGHRVRDRAQFRTQHGAGQVAGSGGLFGGAGGGIQYAHRRRDVHARRNHGRSARHGAGNRRAEFGRILDGAALFPGRRSFVSRPGVSSGASFGIGHLCCARCRRRTWLPLRSSNFCSACASSFCECPRRPCGSSPWSADWRWA